MEKPRSSEPVAWLPAHKRLRGEGRRAGVRRPGARGQVREGRRETASVKSPKDAWAEREQGLRVYGSGKSKVLRGASPGPAGQEN